jgi:hypothetical protein
MKACKNVNLTRVNNLFLLGDVILCNKEIEENRNLAMINLYSVTTSTNLNKISKKEIIIL